MYGQSPALLESGLSDRSGLRLLLARTRRAGQARKLTFARLRAEATLLPNMLAVLGGNGAGRVLELVMGRRTQESACEA